MAENIPITVTHGDGIAPEIMAATLRILKEAGVHFRFNGGTPKTRDIK